MQQLRSFSLPTPTRDVHDYAKLQALLQRGVGPRLLAFSILGVAPLLGFLRPPAPWPVLRAAAAGPHPPPPFPTTMLRIFLLFNALSFLTCAWGWLISASHYLSCQNPNPNTAFASVASQRKRLAALLAGTASGVALLASSCVALAAAFPCAGWIAAGGSRPLQSAVLVPSIVGGFFLLQALVYLVKHFLCWWASFVPDLYLWRAMCEETVFGRVMSKLM